MSAIDLTTFGGADGHLKLEGEPVARFEVLAIKTASGSIRYWLAKKDDATANLLMAADGDKTLDALLKSDFKWPKLEEAKS